MNLLMSMLAYRMFLDPLPIWQSSRWPWLLLPLCLGVAIVYKAIRVKKLQDLPREALHLMLMIIFGMGAAALVLALVVRGLER